MRWDSCFSPYLHKYWSLILRKYYTHCIPGILIQFFGFPLYYDCLLQQTTRQSCELSRHMTTDGSDPQHRASHFEQQGFSYNQDTSQSWGTLGLKQNNASCTSKQLWRWVNSSDMFKTLWTSSSLFCFAFLLLLLLLWERLWALKQNNAGTCCSSTRCKLQTKGVVTGRSVVMRGLKVSTEGKINRGRHTSASTFRSRHVKSVHSCRDEKRRTESEPLREFVAHTTVQTDSQSWFFLTM